ncbi:hypothetical protein DICPUDRAFT_40536 [Dictyostelium purpureum]|uniref:Alpha-mannosidase n=1 Tax=Dictyostelium purpureum TaxID=5786 RepID=F0ZYD4_DICPU|nr:uncharacterized protein DICPUDRAFT_40536 [Dictyostelium purpureum]EGC31045.1 hypothetical protein DICPUDRAFT_40536 [Dictyostelium purpureum]|eukprot:XP_003292433.1 hypothetical protein DICPUDRAFT_40536 [Dictyostelium purpureum]
MRKVFIVFIFFILYFSFIIANANLGIKKGLKVFLIPHSHCDGGWLQDFKSYYNNKVQYILTGVVNELNKDKEKKFNWVEIKQLSFITGGLVQNDEATANIDDIIEQMTQGHLWLKENLNYTVEYAWQIDPFGYSSITPTLFRKMGIKGLVINRVSNSVKNYMRQNRAMEFIWRGSDTLSSDSEIIVSTLDDHYSYPRMIDPYKSKLSVKKKVEKFVDFLNRLSTSRNTNVLMVQLGDDFLWSDAEKEFRIAQEWLDVVKSKKQKYNIEEIKFATLSEYFEELNNQLEIDKKQLFLFDKDFFPYETGKNDVWSGYFSTRPVLKKQIRDSSNLLRHSEIIYTFAKALESNTTSSPLDFQSHLNDNRNIISLSQHHDIVTGTSRSYVLYDQFKKLQDLSLKSYNIISNSIESLLSNSNNDAIPLHNGQNLYGLDTCLNIIDLGVDDFYSLVFQNSLGWSTKQHVSIRIKSPKKLIPQLEFIEASTNKTLQIQALPIRPFIDDENTEQEYNLISIVNIDALGLNSFILKINSQLNNPSILSKITKTNNPDQLVFSSRKYKIEFDMNGFIKTIKHLSTGHSKTIEQSFNQYKSKKGGAYILNPGKRERVLKRADQYYIYDGPLVSQLNLLYGIESNFNVSSIVIQRLYKHQETSGNEDYLPTENIIETGYSFKGEINREKTINYKVEAFSENNSLFFTDNGMENRIRYYDSSAKRPDNYYPALHFSKLTDTNKNEQFTIYIDRSLGTTSPSTGEIEIMLHRSMSKDDSKGLSWPNRDTSRSDGKIYFNFDTIEAAKSNEKKLGYQLDHSPIYMVKKLSNLKNYFDSYKTSFSPLLKDLPNDIHLMTLKTYSNDKIGLRFFNFYKNSQNLNFNNLFKPSFKINNINQTNLAFLDSKDNTQKTQKKSFLDNFSLRNDLNFPIKSGKSENKYIFNHLQNLNNNNYNTNNHNINPLEIKSFTLHLKNNNTNNIITNHTNSNENLKIKKYASYLIFDKNKALYTYDFSVYPVDFSYYNDRGTYVDNTLRNILILSISIPVVVLSLVILGIVLYKKKKKSKKLQATQNNNNNSDNINNKNVDEEKNENIVK